MAPELPWKPPPSSKLGRYRTVLPRKPSGDEAVEREREKVMNDARCHGNILTLQNLTKVYGSRVAVDQLCLSMEKAEVRACEMNRAMARR